MSPHVPAPRRFRHRLLTLLGGVLLAGSATAQAPATDTLTAQRTAFRQAWASATQQGGNGWRARCNMDSAVS